MSDQLGAEMFDENGGIRPETEVKAKELMEKVAIACSEYHPSVVLTVLEAALTEEINTFSPILADLFIHMMGDYRHKAAMLLTLQQQFEGMVAEEPESVSQEPASNSV